RQLAAIAEPAPAPCDGQPATAGPPALTPERLAALEQARGPIERAYPLGPLQEHMLTQALRTPAPGLYVVQNVVSLHHIDIDPAAYERAWQKLYDRHEVLRTSFLWRDQDRPLQLVHRAARAPFRFHDVRSLPGDEQQRRLDAYIHDVWRRGFDLE